jgi:hypothetical protein
MAVCEKRTRVQKRTLLWFVANGLPVSVAMSDSLEDDQSNVEWEEAAAGPLSPGRAGGMVRLQTGGPGDTVARYPFLRPLGPVANETPNSRSRRSVPKLQTQLSVTTQRVRRAVRGDKQACKLAHGCTRASHDARRQH